MKIGVIADDLTGACDIALTLAEGGLRTALVMGAPDGDVDVEAGVVALRSRMIPVAEAVRESLAACDWLIGQGAEQIVFKVCETFGSSEAGNIGPVAEALAERLEASQVMVCPASPAHGRGVYMGHLILGDVKLEESGMQNPPLTPMHSPDLRQVLARQTSWPVGHIPHPVVAEGAAAIVAGYADSPRMLIVDAMSETDLRTIGKAAAGRKLLVGGSAIALGLPANFGKTATRPAWEPVTGPGVILSGSCSSATRRQIARFREIAPAREVTARAIMDETADADNLADWVMAQKMAPLIFSSADPATGAVQKTQDRTLIAQRIQTLFATLAAKLVARGVRRIVVAGDETAGAVIGALNARVLHIGPKLAAGVPSLRSGDIALAITSGNSGDEDFFQNALREMGADS